MNDPRPLLSVCIPTYNRADLLEACLRSVLSQVTDRVEVVVSDNASPDRTRELRRDQPGLRWFEHEANRGMRWNVDFVSREARGEFLLWLSDDDELLPGALGSMLRMLASLPNDVAYVWSALPTYDHQSGRLLAVVSSGTESFFTERGMASALRHCESGWALTRQTYRRRLFNERLSAGIADNAYFGVALAFDALLKHRAFFTPEHFVRHRHGNEEYWDEWGRDQKLRRVRLDADFIEVVPETLAQEGSDLGALTCWLAGRAWVAQQAWRFDRQHLRPERPADSAWYLSELLKLLVTRGSVGSAGLLAAVAPSALGMNAASQLRAGARRLADALSS